MVDIEKERAAFEAWHGGVYRGLYEDIAWAAWKQRAATQPAPEPESVPIPTTVNMARMMLSLGYRYLQENAPQHLIQPAPIPARPVAWWDRAVGGFYLSESSIPKSAIERGGVVALCLAQEVAGTALTDEAKDAARYRWLRENSVGQWDQPIVVEQLRAMDRMQYIGPLTFKALDKAIDAAIASHINRKEQE